MSKVCYMVETFDQFKLMRNKFKKDSLQSWEDYVFSFFKDGICYIPEDDCFISYDKAVMLGFMAVVFSENISSLSLNS